MARSGYIQLALLSAACGSSPPTESAAPSGPTELVAPAAGRPRLLVFSRTQGFRHDSIPAGLDALAALSAQRGYGLSATEDGATFTDAALSAYAAVVFLNTTGDVLNDAEQQAFERYIAAGHGYVGVHSASDCEYDWPFYGALVGAYFAGHSQIVAAELRVEPVMHAAVSGIAVPWRREDEWYGFRTTPRGSATVLLTVDESTYDPGPGRMGVDHPVAWYHEHGGGRAFYTALGHTRETYRETTFLSHLLGGLEWAAAATAP
jgi:type 1 glutamine amidotransferase